MKFDERDLYTGLSALHWATISTSDPRIDKSFYKGILEKAGRKALELGCGAGRLLLAFLQEGFDVQGVDISGDMLSVCRQHANAMGLDPVLYEQQMQQLDLPDQFNAIYIPCGGFQCVMGRRAALETLRRCHAHLEPGGILAFNVAPAHSFYYWGPKEIHAWPGHHLSGNRSPIRSLKTESAYWFTTTRFLKIRWRNMLSENGDMNYTKAIVS